MQPDPDLQLILRTIGPIIGVVAVILAVTVPGAIAWVLRGRRSNAALPARNAAIEARLERIESAVDSIAIEVERISEAQRFSAKLQSESHKQAQISSRSDG